MCVGVDDKEWYGRYLHYSLKLREEGHCDILGEADLSGEGRGFALSGCHLPVVTGSCSVVSGF